MRTLSERATPRARSAQARRSRLAALFVLAAIVSLAANLRTAIAVVPPLLSRIEGPLGISPTVAGVLGSLPTLAFALGGIVTPWLLRRSSAERLAVIALALAAAGQLVRPFAGGVGPYLAGTVVALIGMGIGNVIAPSLVKAWFPDRLGPVTAAYVTVITVGTALPALVAVPLADARGWRFALALWGGVAAVSVLPWLVVARRPRTVPVPVGDHARRLPLHRSRTAWGLSFVFAMTALNIYSMIAWLPVRLTDAGMSEAAAGSYLALYAGIGIPASIAVPVIAARTSRHPSFVVCFAVSCGLGYTGLLFAPLTFSWLWIVLAGLGGAGFPLVLTLFGLRSRTPATAGALSGFAQGRGYAVAALGPFGVGLLHESTGGWGAPFALLFGTLAVMLVGAWLLRGAGLVEDETSGR